MKRGYGPCELDSGERGLPYRSLLDLAQVLPQLPTNQKLARPRVGGGVGVGVDFSRLSASNSHDDEACLSPRAKRKERICDWGKG